MKPLIILIPLLLCAGCSTTFMPHGIPNLAEVDPSIYRGGQPTDEGWQWLAAHGVTNVIKLNPESEGSDSGACALGMRVGYFPITAEQMFFGTPWNAMVAANNLGPGAYVHCAHGQDRTGLTVAIYRLQRGMPKPEAEREMINHGFHKSLPGLWAFWKRFQ